MSLQISLGWISSESINESKNISIKRKLWSTSGVGFINKRKINQKFFSPFISPINWKRITKSLTLNVSRIDWAIFNSIQTLHSCGVMLWYFGQPEIVWCISNLPVMWPCPSQPRVGHFFILFTCCRSLTSVLDNVLDGELSDSQSVWDISNDGWIFLGRPRFFLPVQVATSPELVTCTQSGHIVVSCFSTCWGTHNKWNPLLQLSHTSSYQNTTGGGWSYRQTTCFYGGNSVILQCNIPILIDSLI